MTPTVAVVSEHDGVGKGDDATTPGYLALVAQIHELKIEIQALRHTQEIMLSMVEKVVKQAKPNKK